MSRRLMSLVAITTAACTFALAASVSDAAELSDSATKVPGTAIASATTATLQLSPATGAQSLDIGFGRTLARYDETTARAEAGAFEPGLLETFFGESLACDDTLVLPNSAIAPLSRANSNYSEAEYPNAVVYFPGENGAFGAVAGVQDAYAAADPLVGSSTVNPVDSDNPILALTQPHAEATAQRSGGVREARAVSTGTSLKVLGGLLEVLNPRWEATARSGDIVEANGSFTFTGVRYFGIDFPPSLFQQFFGDIQALISNLLSGFGVTFKAPELIVAEDLSSVEMTGMWIGIQNPTVFAPILDFFNPLLEELKKSLVESDCDWQSAWQIVELTLGVLRGTGSVGFRVGGATAKTIATDPYVAPTTTSTTTTATSTTTTTTASTPTVPFTDRGSGSRTQVGGNSTNRSNSIQSVPGARTTPSPKAPTAKPIAQESIERLGATPRSSFSSRTDPGSSGGTAATVAWILLGLVVLLVGGDRYTIWRSSRRMIRD